MAKQKTGYVCTECGADFSKWMGQCTECGTWNTVREVRLGAASKKSGFQGYAGGEPTKVAKLNEINLDELPRFSSGMEEFDRVLGGGFVPGSVKKLCI